MSRRLSSKVCRGLGGPTNDDDALFRALGQLLNLSRRRKGQPGSASVVGHHAPSLLLFSRIGGNGGNHTSSKLQILFGGAAFEYARALGSLAENASVDFVAFGGGVGSAPRGRRGARCCVSCERHRAVAGREHSREVGAEARDGARLARVRLEAIVFFFFFSLSFPARLSSKIILKVYSVDK
jgi:hypothetical protein